MRESSWATLGKMLVAVGSIGGVVGGVAGVVALLNSNQPKLRYHVEDVVFAIPPSVSDSFGVVESRIRPPSRLTVGSVTNVGEASATSLVLRVPEALLAQLTTWDGKQLLLRGGGVFELGDLPAGETNRIVTWGHSPYATSKDISLVFDQGVAKISTRRVVGALGQFADRHPLFTWYIYVFGSISVLFGVVETIGRYFRSQAEKEAESTPPAGAPGEGTGTDNETATSDSEKSSDDTVSQDSDVRS